MRHPVWWRGVLIVFACAVAGAADAQPVHARATSYDNVHIRVGNQAEAVDWYVKHLGATTDSRPDRVYFGDVLIALVRTSQPAGRGMIDHFALSFADVDARIRALTAAGVAVKSAPKGDANVRGAFIEDPWGVTIELLQDPNLLGFHHVHLSVPNPDAALTWYAQMLGGERGRLRGLIDGVKYGKVWIVADSHAGAAAPPAADGAITNIAWRVADIHKAVAELKSKSVRVVTEPRQIGPLWYAFVEGPGGIRTELLQRPE